MVNINDFRRALAFVLEFEGGYSNDPDDPGGETKWGISKRAYPNVDILNLTPEQALEIYSRDYWDALDCDSYSYPNAISIFDTAVNCGVNRTRKWIELTNKSPENIPLHEGVLQFRRKHYYNLADQNRWAKKYLNGWLRRLNKLRKEIEVYLKDNGG